MSLLGKVASVVTDPGEIVKDAVNSLLPKEFSALGHVAGAAADILDHKNPMAIKHALQAVRDLPQAVSAIAHGLEHAMGESTRLGSGHSTACRGTAAFEPTPPPRGPQVNVTVNGGQVSITVNNGSQSHMATGWHHTPPNAHGWHIPPMQHAWHGGGTPAPGIPAPGTITSLPPGTPTPSGTPPGSSLVAAGGPSSAAPAASELGTIGSKNDINTLTDAAFMSAIREGKISPDVANDPAAMRMIQERMNRITEMNQLMSQMLAAMHQMSMSTIQNIRA